MTETIIAIATPIAESAIGVVRLSGKNAISIVNQICVNRDLTAVSSHQAVLSRLEHPKTGEWLDESLIIPFRAPKSFTGEDVVEISCHGNPSILREVVRACLELGARAAEPGEFTERAYLNGKMDLTQAEAVNDLIRAHTRLARASAGNQLEGRLMRALSPLHEKMLDMLSRLEVAIDHSDLDLEFSSRDEIQQGIAELIKGLEALLKTSRSGKILHHGLRVTLIGTPNTGKSSLMNLLLKEDRVIVSDIAGTTRDLIEDELNICNIPVRLADTAGIRDSSDQLEQLGVERSRKAVEQSDLLLFLVDMSRGFEAEDRELYSRICDYPHIVILNKIDLKSDVQISNNSFKEAFGVLRLSAQTGEGLQELEKKIEDFYWSFGQDPHTDVLLTNVRQEDLVRQALNFLKKAETAILQELSEEFVAADVRHARQALEEITGKTDNEAILDRIFSAFCIGK